MKLDSNIQFVLPNTAMGWEVISPPTPMRRAISAYADYDTPVAGTVKATSNGHGFTTDDIITISGSSQSQYNGTHSITRINGNEFYFTATWSSDGGASVAKKVGVITLARADVKVILYISLKCYYRFSVTQPSEANGQLVATTDLFVDKTTGKELYVPHGLVDHKDDAIYLLLLAEGTGAPVISAVVQ